MRRESSTDGFGRDWSAGMPLAAPFHAVKVTGALFHTQGGLAIDTDTRVKRRDGISVENLYAAAEPRAGFPGPWRPVTFPETVLSRPSR
jgi:fumarate reductase flavoprotein subunit